MAKREITIWDIIFWLGMVILIIYIILKLLNVINTPDWVNLLPLITLAFVICAFYQRMMFSLDRIFNNLDYFKKSIAKLTQNDLEFDKRIFSIEKQQEMFSKFLTVKIK
ncbi:MAG: hypothetical protein AABY22_04075 [Nanoarchaeota archaeon]